MSGITITIATLRAAGLTAEQIVRVIEIAENERRLTRREQNRINQQNQRTRHQNTADAADAADAADTPPSSSSPSPSSSPIPPLITTPSPSPFPHPFGAADAASGQEVDLFRRGKTILGSQAGGLIAKLLDAKGRNIALARAAIEQASTKENPREYVSAIIRKAHDPPERTVDPRL